MDRLRVGAALLAPGAAIFALRALLLVAGTDPSSVPGLGIATALGGALSLVGLAVCLWALGSVAVAGAACVLVGHFAVSSYAPDMGAGLVYLGTGLLVAPRAPTAALPAALAMVGALVREASWTGHAAVAVGAGWLAFELVALARPRSDMNRQR